MNIKEIKEIVDLATESDLCELSVERKDSKLYVKRPTLAQQNARPDIIHHNVAPVVTSEQVEAKEEANVDYVKSPMVGTFYRAPSPDTPPFVGESTRVLPETTVCIIEAMKVMNEIQAEKKGIITEIMVENGESVEFGQQLFKIKTDK